ncbi:hypothetical protein PPMP20_01010 [Paraburkholderia phymatum]|uniref:Transmembrane protein n=1 Tax=Paraburkholderia phymatum (strain DSM 17167 / CIP 108236 / LMG 21445 / STM815) TaxID=391038 RepID=B2JVQ9_PARP8|nr:hypothetical protein [Paraburkholderia phymatum]ACC75036.1 hypothetical protein Bphy_5972 [Paraburkholderia phymatum STM815]
MKVIRATWQALCVFGSISLYVAAFFLWSAIAAGAGWMLAHLPDVWSEHLDSESSMGLAIAAITSYAVVAGALFLAFCCGIVQMLADAYTAMLLCVRKRRSRLASPPIQRRRPFFVRRPAAGSASARIDSPPAATGAEAKIGAGR